MINKWEKKEIKRNTGRNIPEQFKNQEKFTENNLKRRSILEIKVTQGL